MENEITNSEYGRKICGILKNDATLKCPQAIIPVYSVEHIADMRGLSACFVHVEDNNSDYYIDDKYRMILTYAGPVEENNYDFAANPRKLRSQWAIDFDNNKAAYYNKEGNYRLITLEVENDL